MRVVGDSGTANVSAGGGASGATCVKSRTIGGSTILSIAGGTRITLLGVPDPGSSVVL